VKPASIRIDREVLESLLAYAREAYPREGILLLRGKSRKGDVHVTEVLIPPLATHAPSFSSFPLHTLPFDLSIVGTAHSHPSGAARPSLADLNNFYGRVMVIMAAPFRSEKDVGVFNRHGELIPFELG